MIAALADFHWLRPGWLLLLPVLPLLLWVGRDAGAGEAWRKHCDATLLAYLGDASPYRTRRRPLAWLLLGWLLGVLALSGPTWERAPSPVYRSTVSRVVVLDLSRSMDAADIVPSRLTRARFKVADLLSRSAGGQVGLVVFAGDAFALAPLTDDVNTLLNLLPTLETALMPVQGSRADLGIERALELMRNGAASRGDIVLVTDGAPAEAEASARRAREAGYRVAVLAVGTNAGAPIPDTVGGFVKDTRGRIVVAGVDSARLLAIATAGGGRLATLSADDGDIDRLLQETLDPGLRESSAEEQRQARQRWRDRGPWLVLLLLPVAALAFRRGWLLGVCLAAVLLPPTPASALQWSDLWRRPEQRVQDALSSDDVDTALSAAADAPPAWRGSALYRAGDYAAAADAFAAGEDVMAHYNRGNALALAGRLQESLAAYDRALARQPGFEDAAFNRALVEKLLQQQEQDQNQSQQQQDSTRQQDEQQQDRQAGDQQGGKTEAGDEADAGRSPGRSRDASGEPRDDAPQSSAAKGDDPQDGAAGAQSAAAGDPNTERGEDAAAADAGRREDEEDARPGGTALAEGSPVDDATAARIEQMLRRVPDDPGGLLRRKFALEHARRAQQRVVVEQAW